MRPDPNCPECGGTGNYPPFTRQRCACTLREGREVASRALTPGRTYRIEMDDCCVAGTLIATFKGHRTTEDDPTNEYADLLFEGATFERSHGMRFTEEP